MPDASVVLLLDHISVSETELVLPNDQHRVGFLEKDYDPLDLDQAFENAAGRNRNDLLVSEN